ncbi:MAG: hypothetical protein AAGK04_06495 [Planctomycetota bacterium]
MLFLLKAVLFLTLLTVAGIGVYGMVRRKYELMSWRNLFLGGMCYFYALGGLMTLDYIGATERSMGILAMGVVLFMLLFLISNGVGSKLRAVDLVPQIGLVPTPTALIVMIGAAVAAAILSAGVSVVGYLSALATQFKDGFAITAVGLAAYYAIAKRLSPIALGILAGTMIVALAVSLVGTSGRRGVLAVFIALGWMWWYAWARYHPISKTLVRAVLVGSIGIVVLVGYTSVRHQFSRTSSLAERFKQLGDVASSAKIEWRLFERMLSQDTIDHTLFIVDTYPSQYDLIPLHGIYYYVVNPIPRQLFPDKPIGLGLALQEQRSANANLGTGILGHGWAEAQYLGIAYYAIFFGVLTGVIDRLARNRAHDPFLIVLLGSSLGNIFALPRGETSLFLAHATASLVSSTALVVGVRIVAGPVLNAAGYPIYPRVPGGEAHFGADAYAHDELGHEEQEYDEYADYGQEAPDNASEDPPRENA